MQKGAVPVDCREHPDTDHSVLRKVSWRNDILSGLETIELDGRAAAKIVVFGENAESGNPFICKFYRGLVKGRKQCKSNGGVNSRYPKRNRSKVPN